MKTKKIIYLLHGWSGKREYWSQLEKQLKDEVKTEAIDFPGFGEEELISDDWGVPEYANWLVSRIEKSQNTNVILLGHSFGGRVAAEVASRRPKWLRGLILDASPCIYRPSKEIQNKIALYKTTKRFLPSQIRKLFYPEELKDAHNKGLGKIFRKVVVYDQTKQIQKVNVPTLLIWGDNDPEVPLRIGKEINKLIPKSKLEVFSDSGHFPLLDKPYLYYGLVKKFIQTI